MFERIARVLSALSLGLSLCLDTAYGDADLPAKSIEIPVEFHPANTRDCWINGYWIMLRRSSGPGDPAYIWTLDRNGGEVTRRTSISLPETYHLETHGITVTADGTAIISAELWRSSAEVATVLIYVKPPGTIDRVVQTDGFFGAVLGTIGNETWAFGSKPMLQPGRLVDHDTVVRYDHTGRQLATYLPRSSFGDDAIPTLYDEFGPPKLVSSPARVGVYSPATSHWVEFDVDGSQLYRLVVPPPASPGTGTPAELVELVMLESGRVYAYFLGDAPKGQRPFYGIHQLDRKAARWVSVESFNPIGFGGLFGSDGDMVVLRSGCCRYGWFSIPDVVEREEELRKID